MKKVIALVLIVTLVINLILFGTGVFSALVFWMVIGVAALVSYLLKTY